MTADTQLSLFDISAPVETTYKVGDFVKLKRKTPHAACLKKGAVIQIEAIHPRDGSCKFWNESTESWSYVYPSEFSLIPAEIDSVTNSEVTESKVPPAEINSVTNSEVTELKVPPAEINSVTNSEVTESTVPPAGIDSVTNSEVTESTVPPAEIDSVTNSEVTESTVPPAEIDSVTNSGVTESTDSRAIAIYSPKGTARGGKYFRFSYKKDCRVKHIHIPGGNTGSPIAIARVEEVRSLLAAGVSPVQVAVTIRSWRGGTNSKPLCD